MNYQSTLYVILLLIFPTCSLSTSINIQFLELNPTADSSTSWINHPSSLVVLNSTEFSSSSFSPILYRGSSNGSQFLCGFYCFNSGETETTSCLFGVLIFQNSSHNDDIFSINEPKLVWSANRHHPVKINATLNFTSNGDLILKDSDGTLIWSTNSGAKEITGLILTEMGNLLIHGKNNQIVWQSFDHPTDTLLPNQRFFSSQFLLSSTSISDFSPGSFSIVFEDSILSAYIQSNPPLSYFRGSPIWTGNEEYFKLENNILSYREPLVSTRAQFMRLDSDGSLKVYVWNVSDWNVACHVFPNYIGECGHPLACGKYGICSSGQCSCPDEANNQTTTFNPINKRQPNLGCNSSTPIFCNNSKSHFLLELQNTSYMNLNQEYKFTKPSNTTLEGCKASCLRNCSCKAAFFVEGPVSHYSSIRYTGCFLVSEVYSIKDTIKYVGIRTYLKLEKVEEDSPVNPNSSTVNPPVNQNSSTVTSHQKKSGRVRIIEGSSIGAVLSTISVFVFFLIWRRKNEIEEFDNLSFNQGPTRFSHDQLKSITNNYLIKLGQGGFGSVFEGTLSDGTKVAVKRLDGLRHIKKSFLAEVETIGSIHHVNLVKLIGFCAEKSHGLLVYEYMPKGSLDKWIFQTNKEFRLDWEPRKKIILDIAKGLAYLHEDCRCKIFHLDIKPQNILLDENLNAKVSDFGLAKLIDKDQSQVMTALRGTPGYLAPEWLSSIITEKVDVYSFGVVVLEILCGRKNVDRSQPQEDMHLLTIIKSKEENGELEDIIDMHNEDMQSHVAEILKMMKIAKWCIQSDYTLRPTMSMVVKTIESSLDVENHLDFDFTKRATFTSSAEDAFGGASVLTPTALSGPR